MSTVVDCGGIEEEKLRKQLVTGPEVVLLLFKKRV